MRKTFCAEGGRIKMAYGLFKHSYCLELISPNLLKAAEIQYLHM